METKSNPGAAIDPDPIFVLIEPAEFAKAVAKDAEEKSDQKGEPVYELVEEFDRIRWDAEATVLNAKPQSSAGAAALLMFTAEMLAECDCNLDTERFMPVFVNAARAITEANASKIVVSDALRKLLDSAEKMD